MIVIDEHWSGLELRHLEILRAIAARSSFRGAAEDLGLALSVVSQGVSTLEAIVGLRLVDRGRGRRTVALTQAGVTLLRHAEAIEARLAAARADLRAISDGTAGVLRVGTYQSVSARILPTLLHRFTERLPGVLLEVRESPDDDELLRLLASGALDLGFTTLPLPDGPFVAEEMLRDPWLLMVQAGSPLASLPSPVSPSRLADVPLIGFSATSSVQSGLEDYLRGSGVAPRIVFRSNDNVAIHALVATGFGTALMPALAVDMADARIAKVAVDIAPRVLALAWHADRERTPAMLDFIALAHEVCGELRLSPS